ncbi:MAG: hypothetical protein PWP52_1011 [Bacteroidales bacterium]|nr:hypothetical protein [Bacteroidales bacterium]
MKKIIYLALLLFLSGFLYGQKVIEGRSSAKKIQIEPTYEKGFPPNLFVDLSFVDANGNGIIEAEESAALNLTITNKGKGKAQGLNVVIDDNIYDRDFVIDDHKKIYFINPDESVDITIPIKAGFNVKTAEHKLKINVNEHFGYDMDPAMLILNTLEYQKPKLVFSGLEIVDQGQNASAIIPDGKLQAGEMAQMKIVVQNVGQNISYNTNYTVYSTDKNIFIENGKGTLGNLAIGEVKEFWVNISPNKRITSNDKLPVYLSLSNEKKLGELSESLPVVLDQKPPQTKTFAVQADIEKLQKQVARFEYQSNKFTANIGTVKNIASVSPAKTVRKNAIAVVIGVENYADLPPAPYAENDAEIMKKYFKTRLGVDKVVIFKDKEVSGFVFDDIFNPDYGELQKSILKGETDLFVFYSGHGVPSKDGEKIYLFPSDGKIERIESQGYDLNKFYQNLDALGARSVTVFLDACFSGSSKATEKISTENLVSTKGVKIQPKLISPWRTNPNFSVFNSSAANETSLGFDPSQTGLFTYYICVGLQGDADLNYDKKITNGELFDFVKAKVTETSKKIFGVQTPQFNGNRDMILIEL